MPSGSLDLLLQSVSFSNTLRVHLKESFHLATNGLTSLEITPGFSACIEIAGAILLV
jgi:hypothetical protein